MASSSSSFCSSSANHMSQPLHNHMFSNRDCFPNAPLSQTGPEYWRHRENGPEYWRHRGNSPEYWRHRENGPEYWGHREDIPNSWGRETPSCPPSPRHYRYERPYLVGVPVQYYLYDVFVSFRGEDVRVNFLSHFLKELDRKLITPFKDTEIEKGHSLSPELEKAIRSSRIAVVIFSKKYASSSWCLNELLEIVNSKDKIIIPVFYCLDPSDVRKQTGDFGKIFEETCKKNNTEEVKDQWKKALTDVANMEGYHSANWNNEANMIEEIATYVLGKLLSTSSSNDFDNFVGIKDHIAEMSKLLKLESEEVRMVGIWGSSGIGKTTIARALFNQLSRNFQVGEFLDRGFISKSKEPYSKANPDDHNMKLDLNQNFLSKVLRVKDITIDHLGALGERLKHRKVLIIIDDLDDLMVLDSLVGQTQWFGHGSRIIVVTNDKHFLRAHGIHHIYEVSFPTEVNAFEMLCQSAFKQHNAPEGFEMLAVEAARLACSLPLALDILGSYLRRKDKDYWKDMLARLKNGQDDKIEKILRASYDGLGSEEDQAMFRHIACFFNHMEVTSIKSLLADSNLGVNMALQNLADKSLIHVEQGNVVMHNSLQAMGRKIVRSQSIDEPGQREFLVDQKDIFNVLNEGTGTQEVLGISFCHTIGTGGMHFKGMHFSGMHNLHFLQIYSEPKNHTFGVAFFQKSSFHDILWFSLFKILLEKYFVPISFSHMPPKLKLLSWERFPMSRMPSNFCPENLVKLEMRDSELEKLWEGVVSLTYLKEINLRGSHKLKKIPDLSMAFNLEKLDLGYCSSLVELPSSIRNLNQLKELRISFCKNLKTLPKGINLESLIQLDLSGCSQLRSFPEISTNISRLYLDETGIEEVPWRIENFSILIHLTMRNCRRLKCVSLHISKLKHLQRVDFSDCGALTRVDLKRNIASSSLQDYYVSRVDLNFTNCSNLDEEALLQIQSFRGECAQWSNYQLSH